MTPLLRGVDGRDGDLVPLVPTSTSTSPPPSTSASITSSTATSVAPLAVTLLDARTVSVNGTRFTIGVDGDRVVLGDWDCDGTPTAALARPATGEVFVFQTWPTGDEECVATPVPSLAGAVDVHVEARDRCSVLFARRADGTEVSVP